MCIRDRSNPMASDTHSKSSLGASKARYILCVLVLAAIGSIGLMFVYNASSSQPEDGPRRMRRPNTSHDWQEDAHHAHPPPVPRTSAPTQSEVELAKLEAAQRAVVSKMRSLRVVMEKNKGAIREIGKLQDITRKLIMARYGKYARIAAEGLVFRIALTVTFPEMMPDMDARGVTGVILVQTAPIRLMPHAVFLFLELVSKWEGGAFHRNAGHVLQAMTSGRHLGLAFQEYSAKYPHVKGTLGYAGRPGGPSFYISTVDNTRNHGPASQGSKSEADSCFGRVLEGEDVVDRLLTVWGRAEHGFGTSAGNGFLSQQNQHALIDAKLLST
eukprot:TRINITY_DN11661_c0_g5_i1.p1 TRINITY_DN11661_c0_g5~~TRINITY_DN11661_c0_g5_i1.p1  ORF type:complete len:328 (-),score=41.16 TRINITY_DN11661_c0_g5_i1:47-1030(-)